jgi:histidinol-phosphatase
VATLDSDLALAHELADEADRLTLARFRAHDLVVETKPDRTPVSEADRAVEAMVRQRVGAARHGDAVLGEEEGTTGEGPRRWIVDPIDGTSNFIRGIPVYATLIALEQEGEMVVGVASAPALGRRWWASRGDGAFANGDPITVSKVARLEDAHLAYDSNVDLERKGFLPQFEALERRVWRTRGFGDFWCHMMVADGSIDVAVEPGPSLWDLAALIVIVEEAGGRLTDMAGNRTADGGGAITTNGLLHDEVVSAMAQRG